ncbi:DUF3105 domain-containing protein [Dactylosporangium aurantiacum]|uniref:DUF3105 domain-containing protein n=1 Tax=Dactylosporangium aurantiacum TaxID=35754 RepID=A0A9Q9I8A3_9ACTN|nr:DUF3105 domain-containing protein [Dactylosporangium aurantiacum]MDG6107290.1 DUF3105 domain-containing protein [Dactylosporangium aurantiacum]UWZ51182.1 DUF3105 domain-containing protein [Dactylosporangium aurantiacum]
MSVAEAVDPWTGRPVRRRGWGPVAAAVLAAAAVVLTADAVAYRRLGPQPEPRIPGVERVAVRERYHTTDPVRYDRNPPAGGPHAPVWLNCGVYPAPVPAEQAVHSMEHGAVWVTYRPDLPADQVAALRLTGRRPYTILSPYPGLPAPVVASSWGRQLRLDDPGDQRLRRFLDTYREGPLTPERGGPCHGGTGAPQQ